MNELPENFTDDVEGIYDAAETGTGCLLPQREDPAEDTPGSHEFED